MFNKRSTCLLNIIWENSFFHIVLLGSEQAQNSLAAVLIFISTTSDRPVLDEFNFCLTLVPKLPDNYTADENKSWLDLILNIFPLF